MDGGNEKIFLHLQKYLDNDLTSYHDGEIIKTNFLTKKNDIILCWSESQKCLFSAGMMTVNDNEVSCGESSGGTGVEVTEIKVQKIILSTSPVFNITNIICNEKGDQLLLYGPHGVTIVDLPRRRKDNPNILEGGEDVVTSRSTILDESFFKHHISRRILKADWYPGSPASNHVIVLTNDNCLRFYDTHIPEQPSLRLTLFDNNDGCPYNSYGGSSYGGVLGDAAIDFDIAQPFVAVCDTIQTYPIYIMQESGDVWALYCKFSYNRLQVVQQGPLTIHPPSEDNYGCDYCSILCLPSTPTTVVMATRSGIIYHCLIIADDGDKMKTEALYVYESVKLDLTYIPTQDEDNNHSLLNQKLSSLTLMKDKLLWDSYISISNGGVHIVQLPWLNELDQFLDPEMENQCLRVDDIQSHAKVQYILCTQPLEEGPINSLCGCVITEAGNHVSMGFLLSSGEILSLLKERTINKWKKLDSPINRKYSSPLRKLKEIGQFHNLILSILLKNTTIPRVKCGSDDIIPSDAYYNILTKTTRIIREEYIYKMLLAKSELEKRCAILKKKKEDQVKELCFFRRSQLENLTEKTGDLAEKLDRVQGNTKDILERISIVHRKIQTSSPVLSSEEKQWGIELKLMQEKLNKLRRLSEAVKTKHNSFVLQNVHCITLPKEVVTSQVIHSLEAIKIHGVLKDQSTEIEKLRKQTQTLKIQLGTYLM